jgi:hypothetical protein
MLERLKRRQEFLRLRRAVARQRSASGSRPAARWAARSCATGRGGACARPPRGF